MKVYLLVVTGTVFCIFLWEYIFFKSTEDISLSIWFGLLYALLIGIIGFLYEIFKILQKKEK